MKSELAILRDAWFESDEGKRCADENTLPAKGYRVAEFLHNRLEAAFLAGAKANEQCKQEICDDLASRILPAADRAGMVWINAEDLRELTFSFDSRTRLENLIAAAPQISAPAEDEAKQVCAQAYQVVGSLLDDLGQFNHPMAHKILDNLSQHRLVHADVLPWPSLEITNECARELEWRDLYGLAKQAADAGSVCDHDLAGNPITHYDVMVMGSYSPFLLRLINLALKKFGANPSELEVGDE